MAKSRGKGIVYVNENCFGYEGDWAHRPGWQQIADCVRLCNWRCTVSRLIAADICLGQWCCMGTREVHGTETSLLSPRFRFPTMEQAALGLLLPSLGCTIAQRKEVHGTARYHYYNTISFCSAWGFTRKISKRS